MNGVFLKLVNMSVAASWLILAIVLLRFLLKKAPKWVSVLLWGTVAFRLLCPISFESALSLIPSAETFPEKIVTGPSFDIHTGIETVDSHVNAYLGSRYFEGVTVPANTGSSVLMLLSVLWLAGILVMALYAVISYLRLRRSVRTAVLLRDNVFQSEHVSSPFVLGVFKPRIYLPFTLDAQTLYHVVSHEKAHIRRKDHLWKPLGFLLLSLHWFNPFVWLAYILLCRDIELACDEKVIKDLESDQKADYSQALLTCSADRKRIAVCPLAFGEVNVKSRIRSILHYKKPAFWIVLVSVLLCIAVAACFLTDPVAKPAAPPDKYYSLLIGSDGVYEIRISTPYSSGGCVNADGTPFEKGETVPLEPLDGDLPLNGVTIEALDKDGRPVYTFSVPENATDEEISGAVGRDNWLLFPEGTVLPSSTASAPAEKWDLIPMVMVDGILYLDTGCDSPATERTDVFDGQITSQVDSSERPTVNDQSNFGTGYGYQYGEMSGTVELYMNERWRIFAIEEIKQQIHRIYEIPGYNRFIVQIRNTAQEEGIAVAEGPEKFYEDALHVYYFPNAISKYLTVVYNNSNCENFVDALAAGNVTLTDLDAFGIPYTAVLKSDIAIDSLLTEIEAPSEGALSGADHIAAHPTAYQALLDMGNDTLFFVLCEFLAGGQTGLRGEIMRQLLDDLAPEAVMRLHAENGQEYFDAWYANAIALSEEQSTEWIAENQPAVYLLLALAP